MSSSGDRVVFGAIDTETIAHQSITCKEPVVRGSTILFCIHVICPARLKMKGVKDSFELTRHGVAELYLNKGYVERKPREHDDPIREEVDVGRAMTVAKS